MVTPATGMKLMTSLVVPAMVATGPTQPQVLLLVRLVVIVRVEYRMAHQHLQLRPPHDPRQNSLHHLQHKLQYLLLLMARLVPIQPDGLIHMVMAANGMKLMTSLVVPAMVASGPTQQQVSLLIRLAAIAVVVVRMVVTAVVTDLAVMFPGTWIAMAMDAVGTSSTLQIVVYIGAMQTAQQVLEHPMNLAVCANPNPNIYRFIII